MHTLVDIPHIHRFDILQRGGINWLIVCTVKGGQDEPEGDWKYPGKVYCAVLPEDLSVFNKNHQLTLTLLKDGLHHNHGYSRCDRNGVPMSLITADEGVWRFTPPEKADGQWQIELLLDEPVSDSVLIDMDGDGQDELCTLAPFHGERISVWHQAGAGYQKVWDYEEDAPFTHAIYGGLICGVPSFVVGHRSGKKNLLLIQYDHVVSDYSVRFIDQGRGPANVMHYLHDDGTDMLVAANHASNEVALYRITE